MTYSTTPFGPPPSKNTAPTTPATKTSTLFLACNGVPQIRISGATPEETAKNAEVQAMGMLHQEGKMVSFDVSDGAIRGVRAGRETFGRVEGK